MPIVGKVELKADKDVAAGAETSLSDLFSFDERRKEFTLESDVERDKTKLKVTISKLESFEATADTTRKKGEKTSLWMMLKYSDFSKKIKTKEAIKKGDTLSVTVETP
jgi:anthranilate/para-aminobenzoate synthase component I